MAQEKQNMGAMLAGMNNRQKATIVIFAVVVVIIIWQVVGLIGTSTPSEPEIPAAPATPPIAGAPPMATTPGAPAMAVAPVPQLQEKQQFAPQKNTQMVTEQMKAQEDYLKKLNQLQLLKIDQQIAESNQAITAARLATASSEKSISEIYKPSVPQPPPVPENAYANNLATPAPGLEAQAAPAPTPITPPQQMAPPPEPEIPDVAYTVISVSMEQSHWNAVLGYQGKLYNVTRGDTLPVDGSIVVSIDKNGVVLRKDKKRRRISIVSSI